MLMLFMRHQNVRVLALSQNSYLDPTYRERGHSDLQVALTGAEGLLPDSASHYRVKLEWWLEDGQWQLAGLGRDLRRTRQQPQVLTIRIAHQGHTVIVIQVQHPVIATGQVGEQATEPVIEAHPQFVGLPRLLSKGLAAGLLPLTL